MKTIKSIHSTVDCHFHHYFLPVLPSQPAIGNRKSPGRTRSCWSKGTLIYRSCFWGGTPMCCLSDMRAEGYSETGICPEPYGLAVFRPLVNSEHGNPASSSGKMLTILSQLMRTIAGVTILSRIIAYVKATASAQSRLSVYCPQPLPRHENARLCKWRHCSNGNP